MELCTCMEELSFSLQMSALPITIDLDSSIAVSLIQGKWEDKSIYVSIVKEIKYLKVLQLPCATHVSRCQDKASDSLARFARIENRTMM